MGFYIKLKIHDSLEIREMPNICFQHSQISMIHFKTLLATCQANPIDFQIDGTINTINVYVTLTP